MSEENLRRTLAFIERVALAARQTDPIVVQLGIAALNGVYTSINFMEAPHNDKLTAREASEARQSVLKEIGSLR